jgi:hypothetical protein
MKKSFLMGFVLSSVIGGFSHMILAQDTVEPTVTIHATDPHASEAGSDTGTFTVRRAGSTNLPLAVFYHLSGTASNGVDYEQLGNPVQIPAGAFEASFTVKPIDDSLAEGDETVVAQITGSPLACATCGYRIGVPSNAVVTIADTIGGVNIFATDPDASEVHSAPNIDPPSDAAVFTVRRFGETNFGIVVYYEVSGTASNGVDYARLPGQVTLLAGVSSAEIVVKPIGDNLVEGTETVVLTLVPTCPQCLFANPPCLPPQGTNCYPIGPHYQAVAYIHDSGTGSNEPVVTVEATDPLAVEGPFCRSNWWWTTSWNGSNWVVAPSAGDPNSPAWRTNNCSDTNTATFVVRRSGPTNSDLTVYYSMGGTASNGIDYVTLPGKVVISPGHRSARIEVIPIEDSIPEHIETVVLGLLPPPAGTSGAPAYVTGIPSRAAAILLDNDQPRPPCMKLPDGLFHVCHPATNGHNFRLRASPDLSNWTVLCTNTVTEGAVHFVDPDARNFNTRFYQVVPEPSYTPAD